MGEYYVYDIASKKVTKVSDDMVQEPTLSPDATKIAYGFENNLYVKDLTSGKVNKLLLMVKRIKLSTELRIGFTKKNLVL